MASVCTFGLSEETGAPGRKPHGPFRFIQTPHRKDRGIEPRTFSPSSLPPQWLENIGPAIGKVARVQSYTPKCSPRTQGLTTRALTIAPQCANLMQSLTTIGMVRFHTCVCFGTRIRTHGSRKVARSLSMCPRSMPLAQQASRRWIPALALSIPRQRCRCFIPKCLKIHSHFLTLSPLSPRFSVASVSLIWVIMTRRMRTNRVST